MFLSACVRNKQTKQCLIIEGNYSTKTKFYEELIGNGYAIISINNKRDIAAQNYNYKNFAELKKIAKLLWNKNPELWDRELSVIREIESIEL